MRPYQASSSGLGALPSPFRVTPATAEANLRGARASLPALGPAAVGQGRDHRAPDEPAVTSAAEEVNPDRPVGQLQLERGRRARKAPLLAYGVVTADVGTLADAHVPGGHLWVGRPRQDERSVTPAAPDVHVPGDRGLRPQP